MFLLSEFLKERHKDVFVDKCDRIHDMWSETMFCTSELGHKIEQFNLEYTNSKVKFYNSVDEFFRKTYLLFRPRKKNWMHFGK